MTRPTKTQVLKQLADAKRDLTAAQNCMTRYELLTPCHCNDDPCKSMDVCEITVTHIEYAPLLGDIEVYRVTFDEDAIWSRSIIQYDNDEVTAVRHAVQRVFGERVFDHGSKLVAVDGQTTGRVES